MDTLYTKRLILRDWQACDLQDLYEYASVAGVGEMAGWKRHESIEESQAILKHFMESDEVYAVVLKEQNKVVGSVGIHKNSKDAACQAKTQREIGYALSKAYWGQGLMPEAVEAVIRYAFESMHVDVLWCGHFDTNGQSKRVVEKSGFRFYGKGKYEAKALNKTFDESVYIMTRADYDALHTQ